MAHFGRFDSLAGVEPFDRQLMLGIGEARACFPRPRALVIFGIGFPGDLDQGIDFFPGLVEFRIVEPRLQSLGKRLFAEADRWHSLDDSGAGHQGYSLASRKLLRWSVKRVKQSQDPG